MFLQRETLGRSDVSDAEPNSADRLGRECVMKSATHCSSDQEGFLAVCLVPKRSDGSGHIVHSGSGDTGDPAESSILVPVCGKLIPLRGSKANGAGATRFSWVSGTTLELSSRSPEFCAVRTVL